MPLHNSQYDDCVALVHGGECCQLMLVTVVCITATAGHQFQRLLATLIFYSVSSRRTAWTIFSIPAHARMRIAGGLTTRSHRPSRMYRLTVKPSLVARPSLRSHKSWTRFRETLTRSFIINQAEERKQHIQTIARLFESTIIITTIIRSIIFICLSNRYILLVDLKET